MQREIRLLRLLPDMNETSPGGLSSQRSADSLRGIRCQISHWSLDNHPPYFALSYTWGSPTPNYAIYLDGAELGVTNNLKDALFQFREIFKRPNPKRPQFWWIDAICINQSDDQERSWQVQQMQEIYRGAESVMIWLGVAANSSEQALHRLEIIGRR